MSRAERIHQRSRIKAKVLRVTKNWRPIWTKDKAAVGRLMNHGLQICSCYMCGNPRHFGKGGRGVSNSCLTLQERRALAAERFPA